MSMDHRNRLRSIGALASILFSLALTDIWAAAPPGAKVFKTPQAAIDALLAAAAQEETGDLLAVLGPDGKDVVFSGDETADRAGRDAFLGGCQGEDCSPHHDQGFGASHYGPR